MGYIVNYRRWRAMHEAAIFEAEVDKQDLASGGEFSPHNFNNKFAKVREEVEGRFSPIQNSNDTLKSLVKRIQQIFINDDQNCMAKGYIDRTAFATFVSLFAAATAGLSEKQRKSIKLSDVSIERADVIKLVPSTSGSGYVRAVGAVSFPGGAGNMKIVNPEKAYDDTTNTATEFKRYFNHYNVQANILSSGNGQYDASPANFTKGRFDFGETPAEAGKGTIYLITGKSSEAGEAIRKEEAITKEIAGVAADFESADIGFEVGSAAITAEGKTKVAALANAFLERFADKKIDKFTLVSSASPEYGTIKNDTNWTAAYKENISGTTDPGTTDTSDANKNRKLAYDRGVSFMTELNAQLTAKGHPGFQGYTINWKISDTGGPGVPGRYVDLDLESQATKATTITTGTKVSGETGAGTTVGGSETAEMVLWKFTVKHPVVTEKGKEGAATATTSATPGEATAEEATE